MVEVLYNHLAGDSGGTFKIIITMEINDLIKKLGPKWPLFEEVHKNILAIDPKITYRVPTIYVGYYLEDEVVAVVFFRGKFVLDCELSVGFSLKKPPEDPNFFNAKFMQYPGINYCIKLSTTDGLRKKIATVVKKRKQTI